MPSKLRVQKLDNGTGYENTLSSNNAKWHKSCISAYRDVPRFQALLRRLQEEQEKVADATDEPLPAEPRTESIRQTRSAGRFMKISHPLQEVPDNIFGLLEKFTIRLYDSKSKATDVNTVRKDLYDGVKTLSMIPPSKDSLRQHILRAAYQGGQIWGQAHLPEPTPADPTKWGWKKNGDTLQPMWSTLPDVWEKCQLKKKCHCKKMCTVSRCPCRMTCTPCKVDCRCKGNCVDTSTSQLEEQEVDDPLDENGFPQ
ncbi:tRNA (guanine-N(7)-)-methyltransferase [Frankliniella fusca]|uniref:tRNA (Guanine-N(7)-)-methyltransferase n=1 Tax=Frankliniella fusca TaxID=407009 RepID=A0AAE1LKX7_9NEOP|nr:tRNA (guanine-N(7)-)-methyltransferase [Frankliniella fusca]